MDAINNLKDNIWSPPPSYKVTESLKTVQKVNKHLAANHLEV